MTYDLLKLAEECALFFNTNRSESAKRTMRAVATALREAHAEIKRKDRQLEKSEREYLGIRTERDTAIADNARLRKAIEDGPHGELCSSRDGFMIFGHKCDCWKRAALEGK